MGNINKYNAYKNIAPSYDAAVEILNNKGLVLGEPAVVTYYSEDSSEGEKEVKLLLGIGSIGGKVEIIEGGGVSVPMDNYPKEDSSNLVSSGGVWQAIQDSSGMNVPIDDYPEEDSSNLVSSGGVWQAIQDAIGQDDDEKYKEQYFTITPLFDYEESDGNIINEDGDEPSPSCMVSLETRIPLIISTSVDDGSTWNSINIEEYYSPWDDCYYPEWIIKEGQSLQFKCILPSEYKGEYSFGYFFADSYYELSGNIMSLIFGDDKDSFKTKTSLSDYGNIFDNLFSYNPIVYTHKLVLPAKNVDVCCYQGMFSDCQALMTPPKRLPADNLSYGCYRQMFINCSNLEYTPIIEATSMISGADGGGFCCEEMFSSCLKLTTVNKIMPESLSQYCYNQMFYNCQELENVPEDLLPSESLATYCYTYMFKECAKLKTAPKLPAEQLKEGCYAGMFSLCPSLTKSPELKASTLVELCYYRMFEYCERLSEIKCYAIDISATDCTNNWVYYTADFGTFVHAEGMTDWEIDSYNGIPYGWTSVDPGEDTPIMHSELPMIYFDYDFYYSKADGKYYPVNHPDLSTQPSLLSERFGKFQMYEVLLPIYPVNAANSIVPGDDYVVPYMFEDTNYLVFTDGDIMSPKKDIVEAHIVGKGVYDHATIIKEDFDTIEGETINAYKVYALFPIPENLKNLEYLYIKYYASDRPDYGYSY